MKKRFVICALMVAAALPLFAADAATPKTGFIMLNAGNALTVGPAISAGLNLGKYLSLEALVRATSLGFQMTPHSDGAPNSPLPSSMTFGVSLAPVIPLGPGRIYVRPIVEIGNTIRPFSRGLPSEGIATHLILAVAGYAGYRWSFSRHLFLELGGGRGFQMLLKYSYDYMDPARTDVTGTTAWDQLAAHASLWGGFDISFGFAF